MSPMFNHLNTRAFLARALQKGGALEQKSTRDGYGEGLVEAGRANKNVVVLCADVTEATRTNLFKKEFPDRFVQLGVSEQSLASIAAGMALAGKTPIMSAFASFSPGRNWEQIKTCIALQNVHVIIGGSHAGLTTGEDGATHQMLEDLALMRVLPNMTVLAPCDAVETRKAVVAALAQKGPVYIRFERASSPVFSTNKTPFKIGRAEMFHEGKDVTVIACGPLVYEALLAAEELQKENISVRVINCHTIKPLDVKTIVKAAKETGAIVTVENAQAVGGLGSAVAETLCDNFRVPLIRMGVLDRFGESGDAKALMRHFGLHKEGIMKAVRQVMKKK